MNWNVIKIHNVLNMQNVYWITTNTNYDNKNQLEWYEMKRRARKFNSNVLFDVNIYI